MGKCSEFRGGSEVGRAAPLPTRTPLCLLLCVASAAILHERGETKCRPLPCATHRRNAGVVDAAVGGQ